MYKILIDTTVTVLKLDMITLFTLKGRILLKSCIFTLIKKKHWKKCDLL